MPAWYGELCERLSRDVWHGRLTSEQAAAILNREHPVALAKLGRSRQRQSARLVSRGRRARLVWPPRRAGLTDEQAILDDLAALVVGGHARLVWRACGSDEEPPAA